MGSEHDFMTCEDPDCPDCAEAESQSRCPECGGSVISADGEWYHLEGCSQLKCEHDWGCRDIKTCGHEGHYCTRLCGAFVTDEGVIIGEDDDEL